MKFYIKIVVGAFYTQLGKLKQQKRNNSLFFVHFKSYFFYFLFNYINYLHRCFYL